MLDRYEGSASVRTTFDHWIDFMHIVKVGEDWKIINVLWELTPEAWAKRALKDSPDALFESATDANPAGDRYAARHEEIARSLDVPFKRLRPPS